jgi:methanethiol S-methyltransferase
MAIHPKRVPSRGTLADDLNRRTKTMLRLLSLTYAAGGYIVSMLAIAYLVAFLADFAVPFTVNTGNPPDDPWSAILINVALVAAFGLHHSITARRSFKARWTKIVPPHLERSTYLYMSAIATAALVLLWQPIPLTLWRVEANWAFWAIVALYLGVWATMFSATFLLGHFSFFGLSQAWHRLLNKPIPDLPFSSRLLYGVVRHPISLGWLLVGWITPHMTLGQLVFALSVTAYVLIATVFEERDLIAELGQTYRDYRARVPAFLPRLPRKS